MALKFRRGTTAQKSGSLAFGEPYVNTDLGTLQIGGASGDITLGASGTGSTGTFGAISGSGLDITGNANIAGNVTVGGQLTIGDQTSDTVNVVASLSSSLIPQTTNAFDLGSQTKIWRDLYISTGSIKIVSGSTVISSISTNADGSQTFPNGLYSQANIVIGTGSYVNTGQFQIGRRGDNADMNAVLGITIMPSLTSGEGNVGIGRAALYNLTTGFDNIAIGNQAGYGGNHTGNITIGQGTAFSLTGSSADNNVYIGRTAGTWVTDGDGNVGIGNNALIGATGATNNFIRNVAIGQQAGALATSNSSRNIYLGAYAGPTSSIQETYKFYVGNGDNGTQPFMYGDMTNGSRTLDINASTTISGSLRIKKDLIIEGSSSIQNISASNVVIGAAYVTLNTFSPASRFAGLKIFDSGSNAGTASLVWDSLNNKVLYQHPSGADTYNSAWLISGPANAGALGSESGLTINKIQKATDDDHIGDSQITDDGTTVSIAGNLTITGSINAPQFNTLATYTGSVESRFTTLATLTGSNATRLTNLESTSASVNTSVSNLNSFTSSQLTQNSNLATYTASVDGRFTTLASVTSSYDGRFTTLATTTGSLQTSVSNINTTSASLNISVSNINTFTASMSTTSNVRFGSLGIGMAASGTSGRIDAAGDIVAYSTSDKNFKENITPIPNAIDKIRKISGNTYDWKAELKDIHGFEGNDVGVIAQEIEEVLPQLVTTRETGYKAVKYDKLVALLIEGIKEQQQHIDNLTIQVEELKKQKGL